MQRQDITLGSSVNLEPMARTGEQWKPVYLSTALGVARSMHWLAIPMLVVVFGRNAVFPILEK